MRVDTYKEIISLASKARVSSRAFYFPILKGA